MSKAEHDAAAAVERGAARHADRPWYRSAAGVLERRGLRDSLSNGSLLVDKTWDGSFERFLEDHPEGLTFRATAEGIRTMAAIVALARRRGIALMFLYPPEIALSGKVVRNRLEMIALLAELARQHGVPFWDYSADAICEETGLFYNSEHLNSWGARLFTDKLAARVTAHLASP